MLTELPTADFSGLGVPAVLNDYFTGELSDGTPAASRNMKRMQGFMAQQWLEAYQRHTELFERLPEQVGLPESGHRLQKHDMAVAAYFRREFGTDSGVAEALFGVAEKHFAAFKMETPVDYAVMLAFAPVDTALVEDLRAAHGAPLAPPWPGPSATRDFPAPREARVLVRYVTKDKRGYGLIQGGVSVSATKAFHVLPPGRRGTRLAERYDLVAEVVYCGVPVPYAVAAVSAGVEEPLAIISAYKQGVASEYLASIA